MSFTSHGHYVEGTPPFDFSDAPPSRARCGGINICQKCSREAAQILSAHRPICGGPDLCKICSGEEAKKVEDDIPPMPPGFEYNHLANQASPEPKIHKFHGLSHGGLDEITVNLGPTVALIDISRKNGQQASIVLHRHSLIGLAYEILRTISPN